MPKGIESNQLAEYMASTPYFVKNVIVESIYRKSYGGLLHIFGELRKINRASLSPEMATLLHDEKSFVQFASVIRQNIVKKLDFKDTVTRKL